MRCKMLSACLEKCCSVHLLFSKSGISFCFFLFMASSGTAKQEQDTNGHIINSYSFYGVIYYEKKTKTSSKSSHFRS